MVSFALAISEIIVSRDLSSSPARRLEIKVDSINHCAVYLHWILSWDVLDGKTSQTIEKRTLASFTCALLRATVVASALTIAKNSQYWSMVASSFAIIERHVTFELIVSASPRLDFETHHFLEQLHRTWSGQASCLLPLSFGTNLP